MIVIYNEVLDVMRSVLHMYRSQKRKENRENEGTKGLVDDERGYSINKKLILEAWAKYRPTSNASTPRSDYNLLKKVGSSF